ncbi:MAG: SMC family ATPase [Chloroflexi bacterium]|nr:SMC family ATPase [Chloroflexota bacterium]
MIPLKLTLSGFLSYRDLVEVDFTGFSLACISGHNGAGKSSLLDAITWALFGQARKRDEALINTHPGVKAAEVVYTFAYEGNVYRVQRTMPRGKSKLLEFQVQTADGDWRPLSERTMSGTQARIQQILRLDYETFVNAAFFLQGKADQFTQQNASKRKEVLSSILGLEVWDVYKERTAARRRALEQELDIADGRIAEIEAELAEEDERLARLDELEAELGRLAAARKAQEATLDNMRRVTASLDEQRKLVEKLGEALARSKANQAGIQARLAEREAERGRYADLLSRAGEVEAAYKSWQSAREDLARWDEIAAQFHEHEKRRQDPLREIESERARLEEEQKTLSGQQSAVSGQQPEIEKLRTEIEAAEKLLAETEGKLAQRAELETRLQAARQEGAERKAENERLKAAMDELKARIERLEAAEGADCPLCGQPLEPDDRKSLIGRLNDEGAEMGNRWRDNKAFFEESKQKIKDLEAQYADFARYEEERLAHSNKVTALTASLETLEKNVEAWEQEGAKRLAVVSELLAKEGFAPAARARLAEIDEELKTLGYDAAAHDAARRAEKEARLAEEEYRTLASARAALKPLEDEIANLQAQIQQLQSEIEAQQAECDTAAASLAAAESQAPDENAAYAELFKLQEQENRLNQEVGAARQKVAVLDDLRVRKAGLEARREELAAAIGRHKRLERAFGRDGVPALLIEQALPEIEAKANALLERLSDGQMSIRFITQAAYKDKKRGDLKETLDIQISDSAGVRDYEMFSGGEAFRVNFAIRLALSEVLSRRKGARLQTLIIDEGFGSQDARGRQRLIEAINQVRADFEKILVITHLESLKDAFPTRIEVEKVDGSSRVSVV